MFYIRLHAGFAASLSVQQLKKNNVSVHNLHTQKHYLELK